MARDRQTDGLQHFICPIQAYFGHYNLQSSNNACSLLVLCAVRRQRRAVYVILAISERYLYKYGKTKLYSRNNRF